MIRRLWAALKSSYPCEPSARSDLLYGLGCGLFVWLFFTAFEPFGLNLVPAPPRRLLFAGYGLITGLTIVANGRLLPRLWPRWFREENWSTGRQIVLMSWVTLVIGLGSFFLTGLVFRRFGLSTRWLRPLTVVLFTFFVAVFPITVINLVNYARLLKRNTRVVLEANRQLEQSPFRPAPAKKNEPPPQVEIVAENNKDSLRLPLADLLFIQAEENYVRVHVPGGKPVPPLLRSSLARVERQLRPFAPSLFRCHRAFIVNVAQIARVEGNAQGLKLALKDSAAVIPVARRYVGEFRRVIKIL